MKTPFRFNRGQEIQKVRSSLERDGFPRLQMSLLVVLTGISGFIASFILLHVGLVEMWSRYLAAFGFAYLTFLLLLWIWLRTRAEDYSGVDIPSGGSSSSGGHAGSCSGHGGHFGGGGASESFAAPLDSAAAAESGPVGEALGAVAEAGELAIPLVVIVLVVALLLSSFFMIYSAPTLFAELLVDGALSASLYHRLRGIETKHWLETAVSRTVWPFVLTAVVVSATGWVMTQYAPEAHSIGDVIYHVKHQGGNV